MCLIILFSKCEAVLKEFASKYEHDKGMIDCKL